MAEAKFVQITAAETAENFARVYALDESGRHRKWRALEEARDPIFTR